ncbi:RING-H2 finger protein ATL32-like [Miscanthus floridulus]|uniref:RING-H2 finger protein ATL32-like n=1 Tax=Miscanthus floridulus TaxID=154761 RepID=UPI00345A3055
MSSYGPTGALADVMEAAVAAVGSYRVCDTVVLVCLASASTLIILTVAFFFRRAFANGYAAAAMATNGAGATAANGRSRCGLAPSALSAGAWWAQCAICLAVVRDGETVRLLPACGHLFHVECIDLCLRSHATGSLCRRDVVEAPAEKV